MHVLEICYALVALFVSKVFADVQEECMDHLFVDLDLLHLFMLTQSLQVSFLIFDSYFRIR